MIDNLSRSLRRLHDLEAYLAASVSAHPERESQPDEWIVVRRSDLHKVMNRYVGSEVSPEALLQALARQYPVLNKITLVDGLNRTELQLLIDQRLIGMRRQIYNRQASVS
jgi:hypothetical protein